MPSGSSERCVSLFEFWGDKSQYAAWLQGEFAEEADFHAHTLNALRVAMDEELTDTQRKYMEMFFVYGMSMKDIGQELGVAKATVAGRSIVGWIDFTMSSATRTPDT